MPESIYDKLGDYLSEALDSGFFSSDKPEPPQKENIIIEGSVKRLKPAGENEKSALKALGLDESYTFEEALLKYTSLKKTNPANRMLDLYWDIIKDWYTR